MKTGVNVGLHADWNRTGGKKNGWRCPTECGRRSRGGTGFLWSENGGMHTVGFSGD